MNWKQLTAATCIMAFLLVLPVPGPVEVADMPLELAAEPPLVALTFDDGPRNTTTGPLLDGLALREVPATFFLVGSRIAGSEDLIRRMAAEGHQIGVHTYDHVILEDLSQAEFDAQVGRTREALEEILGPGDYWLRPPYGIADGAARDRADSPIVLWSVDPEDWRDEDADRAAASVLAQVEDGSIILMHDLFPSSVDAALRVVDALLERGYCFLTVEQLMARRGVEPENGVVCRRCPPAD